jgi:hypothetical protein
LDLHVFLDHLISSLENLKVEEIFVRRSTALSIFQNETLSEGLKTWKYQLAGNLCKEKHCAANIPE